MADTVLLFGDTGMLGQAIRKKLSDADYRVLGVSRTSADYRIDMKDELSIENSFNKIKPDIVINAAAIVSIDYCEEHPGEAYLINGRAPGVMVEQSRKYGSYFVQISTDHYYCGDKDLKHNEHSQVRLVNEYARSKYVGECLAQTYEKSLVIRTNVVGFRCRENKTFVEWIIDCVSDKNKMTLFNDFYTSSMNSSDFAIVLRDLLKNRPTGILNVASSEVVNKKEFIIELVKELFGIVPDYVEGSIHSASGVKRADSIGLDTTVVSSIVGYEMPDFKTTIKSIANDYYERLGKHAI